MLEESEGPGSPPPYKMIQTIGLSVGAAVAYIIAVLGLMFYCKKRCKAKRLQKQPEGEEPEMECLNGEGWPVAAGRCAGTERPLVATERAVVLACGGSRRSGPNPSWKPGVGPLPRPGELSSLVHDLLMGGSGPASTLLGLFLPVPLNHKHN